MEYLGDADEAGPEIVWSAEDEKPRGARWWEPLRSAEAFSLAGAAVGLTSLYGGTLLQALLYADYGSGSGSFGNPARALAVAHAGLAAVAAVLAGAALALRRPDSARWCQLLAAATLIVTVVVGLLAAVGWFLADPEIPTGP
jgi:hypothetical protein